MLQWQHELENWKEREKHFQKKKKEKSEISVCSKKKPTI